MTDKNFAIILCGGSGTRLWPYSRKSKPKQFLKFDSNLTLFQKTLLRISKFYKSENIYIVTNEIFYFETKGQLADCDISNANIILEPCSKNTLPAISFGVRKILSITRDAIIGVFPSDHEISNDNEFQKSLNDAVNIANSNTLLVFGMQPENPNTGYGYIEAGEKITKELKNIYKVIRFVEKPDKNAAIKYFNKNFLWNSGMFVFSSNYFIEKLKIYQKDIYKLIIISKEKDIISNYSKLSNISIDYGLLEFLKDIIVIKVSFSWVDLGSWNSIHNYYHSKNNDTLIEKGNVVSKDSKNSLIITNDHLIASYGVSDLIVVHDLDATLICHKDKADDLKYLLDIIKVNNQNYLETHPIVNRPWGYYKVLYHGETFKIKSITINPHQQLSLQLHKFRNEHWVVIKGVATVTRNDKCFELKENESTYIKVNEKHRLSNLTDSFVEVIEVSIGSKISEEDIVRFEDEYNRID